MNFLDFPAVTRLHQHLFTLAYRAHEAELEVIDRLPHIIRTQLPHWPDKVSIGLDVGAGTGPYGRLLLDRCQHVVMVEPNHEQAQYLRRAFGDRARIVEAAAGDAAGTAFLVDDGRTVQWRRPLAKLVAEPGGTPWQQPCAVETIDAMMSRFGLMDVDGALVAKIDVEGHELAVLRGMSRTLADRPAVLIVEIEARLNPQSADVFAHFASLGFAAFVYQQGQLVPGSHDLVVAMADRKPGRFGRLTGYRSNFVFLR